MGAPRKKPAGSECTNKILSETLKNTTKQLQESITSNEFLAKEALATSVKGELSTK